MKHAARYCLGIVLLLAVAACSDYRQDVDAVRQARTVFGDKTNDDLAREIAGARGKVEWSGGPSEKYRDNEYIVAVSARIERTTRAGAKRVIELQFIRNRQNQKIAFEQLLIDGQSQDFLSGALNLLLMQLE
jgi:hypothetical protein